MRSLLLMLLVTGCSDNETIEPGVLLRDQYEPMIEMPATANVGTPIQITVLTYGGDCRAMGPTDVTTHGDETVVEPFDRHLDPGDDGACIRLVLFFQHKATVTFDTPGPKTIRFHGRRVSTYPPVEDVPFDVSMPITLE